ncbi:MAG: hypothetical protein ACFFE4_09645 [Candidatus Thorarchaeota archaeon]
MNEKKSIWEIHYIDSISPKPLRIIGIAEEHQIYSPSINCLWLENYQKSIDKSLIERIILLRRGRVKILTREDLKTMQTTNMSVEIEG